MEPTAPVTRSYERRKTTPSVQIITAAAIAVAARPRGDPARHAPTPLIDNTDPVLPIERIDPTDPIDAIDPKLPILTSEPALPIEAIDPAEPIDAIDPAEPIDAIDPTEPRDASEPPDFPLPATTLSMAESY